MSATATVSDPVSRERKIIAAEPTRRKAARRQWELGGVSFPSTAAVGVYLRAMMAHYGPNERLRGIDHELTLALLDHHPHRELVIGCGIDSIFVEHLDYPPYARRFAVRRTDGTKRDYSWHKCLSPPSTRTVLHGVCRRLIEQQIKNFRDQAFASGNECKCPSPRANPKCERMIANTFTCHVDHIPPLTFARLVTDWMASRHLTESDIKVIFRSGYGQHSILADMALALSWCEYHAANARLRILCQPCNGSAN